MTAPVLDLAFAALSDPTRREIVQQLAKGAARVTDLAQPFDMSFNAISKHVKVLERAGLVRRTGASRAGPPATSGFGATASTSSRHS
jgi:DNA-binding transcriptional ArsR family regulator